MLVLSQHTLMRYKSFYPIGFESYQLLKFLKIILDVTILTSVVIIYLLFFIVLSIMNAAINTSAYFWTFNGWHHIVGTLLYLAYFSQYCVMHVDIYCCHFHWCIIFHHVNTSHSFPRWWTFGWFPAFGYYKQKLLWIFLYIDFGVHKNDFL